MTRPLTPQQEEFLKQFDFDWAGKEPTAEEVAAIEAAKAVADRRRAEQEARWAEEDRRAEEAIRPLKEALRAAGIKLEFDGYYEGCWMKYQIGDGPVVEVEEGLDAFDD
jgi:hypothetical protein